MTGAARLSVTEERPTPCDNPCDIRKALRSATSSRHAALDEAFSGYDLGAPRAYRAFLSAHARVLPALEARASASGVWPEFSPRGGRLLADVRALGASPPPVLFMPPCTEIGAAWGLLYVLEGSRLGGALLARRVGAGLPRDYLSSGHTGGSWRRFLEALEAAGARGGATWLAAAETCAAQAFDRFAEAAAIEGEAGHGR